MKLLGYELKKLAGIKYLWVMLALTATLCTGLYYYLCIGDIDFSEPYYDRELNAMYEDFFRRCGEDAESVAPIREAYEAYVRDAERVSAEIKSEMTEEELVGFRVTDEMLAERGVTYENRLGYVRADGTVVPDEIFFDSYSQGGRYASLILSHVDDIVYVTEGAMERFSSVGAEDLPVYEYERRFNETYSSLREKLSETVRPAIPRGAENMLRYREFPIFAYVFLLIASGVVFLNERSVGLLPVVRTAKRGRAAVSAAKLCALLIVAVVTVLCLSAAQYTVTYIKFGITFGDAPAQYMCPDCPYHLTVNGYFLCLMLLRILAAAAFSCAVALIASATSSYIVTYFAGALILGVNIISGYAGGGRGLYALDLIDLGNDTLLSKYDMSLIFGHYFGTLALGISLLTAALVLCGALLVALGGRGRYVRLRQTGRVRRLIPAVRAKAAEVCERFARRRRDYPSSPLMWEIGRIMTPSALAAVAVLFGLSVYSSAARYTAPVPPSLTEYEEYIGENWAGEMTEEKYFRIAERYEELEFLTEPEAREELMKSYTRGEITFEEYAALLDEIDEADDEISLLRAVKSRAEYLHTLKAETGVSGRLFPDTRILRLLDRDFNIFLLIAVVVLFSRMYTSDYAKKSSEGEFAAILRTTGRGRRKTFCARFAAAALISFALAALFEGVDLCLGIAYAKDLTDALSAPISSVEQYGRLGQMTVGGFLAASTILRTFSYVPLALLCCSVSFAVKKLPPTLFVVSLVTLLPYALVYMGVRALKYVDLTAALSGGKLLTRSAEFAVFGGAYGFAAVLLAAYAMISAAAVLYVRQRTGK